MQDIVPDGIKGGALGLSVSRNKGHYDQQGVHVAAYRRRRRRSSRSATYCARSAPKSSSRAAAGCRTEQRADGPLVRGYRAHRHLRRPRQTVRRPTPGKSAWRRSRRPEAGHPRLPAMRPNRRRKAHDTQTAGVPGLADLAPDPVRLGRRRLRAYADPAIRQKLHEEVVEREVKNPGGPRFRTNGTTTSGRGPRCWKTTRLRGQGSRARSPRREQAHHRRLPRSRRRRGPGHRGSCRRRTTSTTKRWAEILDVPERHIGLSDGGAHMHFHGGYGYCTRLLSESVSEKQVMSARTRGPTVDLQLRFRTGALRPRLDSGLAWRPTS